MTPTLPAARLVAAASAAGVALLTGAAACTAGGATPGATIRTDGVGPLKLGMTRAAAVRTGWLSDRTTGCELAGKPYPLVYRLDGRGAPKAVEGTATFANGRLTLFTFTAGVRTANGTTPGVTDLAQAKARYSRAPYSAQTTTSQLDGTRFLRVRKRGRDAFEMFTKTADGRGPISLIGLPYVPICD